MFGFDEHQVHSPLEEDRLCGGARFHHGHLFGRPGHRLWRATWVRIIFSSRPKGLFYFCIFLFSILVVSLGCEEWNQTADPGGSQFTFRVMEPVSYWDTIFVGGFRRPKASLVGSCFFGFYVRCIWVESELLVCCCDEWPGIMWMGRQTISWLWLTGWRSVIILLGRFEVKGEGRDPNDPKPESCQKLILLSSHSMSWLSLLSFVFCLNLS